MVTPTEKGRYWEDKTVPFLELSGFEDIQHESAKNPQSCYDFAATRNGLPCLIEVRSRSPEAKTQFFVIRNTKLTHIEEAAKEKNATIYFVFVNKWGFKLITIEELRATKHPDVKFTEYHYKKPQLHSSGPFIMKVYANRRVQIPSISAKQMKVKDGDRVRWVEYLPGTWMVHGIDRTPPGLGKYRSIGE